VQGEGSGVAGLGERTATAAADCRSVQAAAQAKLDQFKDGGEESGRFLPLSEKMLESIQSKVTDDLRNLEWTPT